MEHPRIKITRDQINQLVTLLDDQDDEQLKLDSLEGETDLFELAGTLVDSIELAECHVYGLKVQIEERQRRIARYQKKIEDLRKIIASLMETAGIKKLPLSQATVYTSSIKGSWKVVNADMLPNKFLKREYTIKPDKEKIGEAVLSGELPNGVTMTNGYTSLSIRRN